MTAATVLSIISALLAVAKILIVMAERNSWMAAGAGEAMLKGIQDAEAAIATGNKARADMHDTNTRDPASVLRDDDGFKRPD